DFVGDKDKVEITLPKGTIDSTTKYKLSVSTDVTNAKGSHMVDSLQTKQAANTVIQLTDSVAPELASAKYIVDTDSVEADTESSTIEVTFNEAISFEQEANGNFNVEINGSKQTVNSVADGDGEDKLKLTLSEAVNVNQDATISIVKNSNGEVVITDEANNKAEVGSSVIANTTKF